ncbi:MAG: hypothetical protein ACOZCO_10650 [Bacteroidota bacterium]
MTTTVKKNIELRPYNATELAKIYKRTPRTMHTWLKKLRHKIGAPIGQIYTTNQVKKIIELLDTPEA